MTELDIAAINLLIEQHADTAIPALDGLATLCAHDERMRSPLNVAIQYHNNELVDNLLDRDGNAINYTPESDAEQKRWMAHMIEEHFEETVKANEEFFSKYHKGEINWQRSPLLQACRYANKHALGRLIKQGAKLDSVDILGYSALELCLEEGGEELVQFFVDCCIAQNAKIALRENALRAIAIRPSLYKNLASIAELDQQACKFKFNLACALLEYDEVKAMLEQGYNVNDSVVDDASPVAEVAFSSLTESLGHPERANLTKPSLRAFGNGELRQGDSGSAQSSAPKPIDLDEIAALMDSGNVDKVENILRQHDEAMVGNFVAAVHAPSDVDPQIEPEELIDRRIKLLDLLASHKLDVKKAHEDANFLFTSYLLATNSPHLLDKLLDIGLAFEKDEMADELAWALQIGCFSIVQRFIELGYLLPEVDAEWESAYRQYQNWLSDKR